MLIEDIELVKFRLRRKLTKIEKRNNAKGLVNWLAKENLLKDESYQNAKKILKYLAN